MTEDTSSDRAPVAFSGEVLFRLLTLGLGTWVLTAIVYIGWFFIFVRDSSLAAVAAPFYAFSFGFIPGGIVLFATGLFELIRNRITLPVYLAAVGLYFLPFFLAGILFKRILSFIPLTSTSSDLAGMIGALLGPAVVVLFIIGLINAYKKRRMDWVVTLRAILIPPAVGLVAGVAAVAVLAFSSPEFRAAGDFSFEFQECRLQEGGLAIDALLDIRIGGTYMFDALYLETRGGSQGGRADTIRFDGASKPPQQEGQYQLRMVWNDLDIHPQATDRKLIFTVAGPRHYEGIEGPVPEKLKEFRVPLHSCF